MPSTMRSPNEFLDYAKAEMLDGREPETREDWFRVMNCVVVNIHHDTVEIAAKFFLKLYDIPMTEGEVQEIIDFQRANGAIPDAES